MRRLPVISGVLVAGALAVAACGSGTPATSSIPTVPAVGVPTLPIAVPTLPTGSIAIPTFSIPSVVPDTALESKYPQSINGNPVTNVSSGNFLAFYQALTVGDPKAQANIQAFATILQNNGINPATLAIGNGQVQLNGSYETITSLHTPGSSAATLVTVFPQLAAITGGDETPPIIASANIGGKNVTTVDDGSTSIDYLYPSNDILWSVSTDNAANAAAIMAALQ